MNLQTILTWSWLNFLTKKRYDALLKKYGSLEDALPHLTPDLLTKLGCREETTFIILNRLEGFDPEAYQKELERRGIRCIGFDDSDYPSTLQQIPDPPIFLYIKGDLSILRQPCIGFVGTRAMSLYGKRVTEYFVPEMVAAGITTVSGLAEGIDATVAHETIRIGGKTVAILGYGPSQILPRSNTRLAQDIIQSGGLILSEFPLDVPPGKHTFPARNRIIAGLSLGTVILEAPEQSGALITAELALEYGRDVFAVPGNIFDPNFAGCHKVISLGQAKLVSRPQDVLEELGIVSPTLTNVRSLYQPQNNVESTILSTLTTLPQPFDDIVQKAKISAAQTNATLTMMELAGAVKDTGGGQWVRT